MGKIGFMYYFGLRWLGAHAAQLWLLQKALAETALPVEGLGV